MSPPADPSDPRSATSESLRLEIAALQARLQETEELLGAIQRGEVDALIRPGAAGDEVIALAGAEQLYRLTVETMIEGALTLAPDGRVLYCNQRLAELLGQPAAQLTGRAVQEIIDPPDRPRFAALLRQARDDIARDRIALRRADGRLLPTLLALRNLPDEASDKLIAVVTDVSELVEAQARRDQLAQIVDSAQDGIIGKTLDGIITSWNAGAEKLYGYRADEMIGQQVNMLAPPERKDEIAPLLARLVQGEVIPALETQRLDKAGRRIDVALSLSPLSDASGTVIGVSTIVHDIRARVAARQALTDRERRFRRLIENATDIIAIIGADGLLRFVSPAVTAVAGYTPEELIGTNFLDLAHPDEQPAMQADFAALQGHPEQALSVEYRCRHTDGTWLILDVAARNQNDTPGIEGIVVTLHDVTALRHATRTLGERVKEQRCLYQIARLASQVELSESELLAKVPALLTAAFQHPDIADARVRAGRQSYETPGFSRTPWLIATELRVNGEPEGQLEVCYRQETTAAGEDAFLADERALLDSVAGTLGQTLAARRGQQALQRAQQLLKTVIDSIPVRVFWKDQDLVYLGCNALFAQDAGLADPQQIIGKDDHQMPWGEQVERYRADDRAVIDSGQAKLLFEEPQSTPQGDTITLLTSKVPLRDAAGNVIGVLGAYMDISKRKQQEQTLLRLNRALRTLSAGNNAVVHAESEQALLQRMCESIVSEGAYAMAWVGYAEQDPARTVRPMASAGDGADYVAQAAISWADDERGRGPAGRCIRSGQPQLAKDIATDPSMAPWRELALQHGYQSGLALPLMTPQGVLGSLMIYSAQTDAFDADERALLEEMAGDLAYGIDALRTQAARQQGLLDLEHSMEATINVLAETVETRDPYTAGHQRRVASIASAIATALELPEERLRGLNLAASIHDIGKINIPAEILAKPGKLSKTEYALVQGHAQAGYEILKDVEFPWPVAAIVHQHHERLDGSGYPRGLAGEQIMLEARILAVADVVEAVASHRPYRAALGLDAALDIIAQGRGSQFDAAVVDACIKLFREDGFALPE